MTSESVKFSVIMSVWWPWEDTRKAIGCLFAQSYKNWELVLVSDGPLDERVNHYLKFFQHYPRNNFRVIEEERVSGIWGNRARRRGLDYCQGDYVCWINHDNVVFPNYLSSHHENIIRNPGCISVQNIDVWVKTSGGSDKYLGKFPVHPPRLSKIDLMNYSMPLSLAREVDAFGPAMEQIHHADWLTFDAAQKIAPVEYCELESAPVGIHF